MDDDEDVLEVLTDILEELGHEVETASSGKSALNKLNDQFDLALVDLKMGDIPGLEIMDSIKKEYPDTATIVLTGHASKDSAVEALRLGAEDFLEKPVQPELLVRSIELALERKRLKELSEAIIRKMEEGLLLLDSEGLISFTNKQFCKMLNYSERELKGKSFLSMVFPEDENTVIEGVRLARLGNPQRIQTSLITKEGMEVVVILSFTKIRNEILTVISDITKIVTSPAVGEDFSYKVEPGRIYLVEEEKPKLAVDAFIDLVKAGYKGTIITREHPDKIKSSWNIEMSVLWLTEKVSGESTIFPNITLVEEKLEPYLTINRVILIDRLDYLILSNSFELVLKSIQKLRDQILVRKSIIILSVDPRTLTEREFSLLQKETYPLLSAPSPLIRDDLMELLIYVAKRNEVGEKPFHKQIAKRFNISRTTVRERLNILSGKGLITEKRRGRLKVVEITEKGKKQLMLMSR